MVANTQYSPAEVAGEVVSQGGTPQQAWVAAALVDGIESNGTLADSNPSSTACGLFQFLDTTWQSNGGTGSSACGASLSEQVSVFLTASSGNNFKPWAPDLGGSYANNAPVNSPAPGSPVANKISDLAAGGTLAKLLGNVPTSWADTGAATPANPAPGPVGAALGLATGGTSTNTPLEGLSGLEQGVGAVLSHIDSAAWWKRVGLFVLGGALIVGGIVLFVSTTKTGQTVESDAAVAAVA